MQLSAALQAVLLDAARAHVRRRLLVGTTVWSLQPAPDPVLDRPAGCFVSLHEKFTHRLRGCVGRIDARQPLWAALHDAAESVLTDPRFVDHERVEPEELPDLEIEVTVLSPLTEARDVHDFDPQVEGVYLSIDERSGCFLPQVARETGWTREQLLDRLCLEKLHLHRGAWRESGARLQKFTAMVIGPAGFDAVESEIDGPRC
jgi:AmmeMemoRadiSam system protein A